MSEDYAYQLSIKFGSHDQMMTNVRGKTAEEFHAALRYLLDNAGTVVLAAETLRAVAVDGQPVGAGVGAQANAQPAQVAQQPPGWAQPAPAQPAQQQPQSNTPYCAHGPMTFKSGMGKNGKPYQAWFCSGPQGQPRCEAKFL